MVYNKIKKEGVYVDSIKTIATIKRSIEDHVGEKVTLKANGGRKKNPSKQRSNRECTS